MSEGDGALQAGLLARRVARERAERRLAECALVRASAERALQGAEELVALRRRALASEWPRAGSGAHVRLGRAGLRDELEGAERTLARARADLEASRGAEREARSALESVRAEERGVERALEGRRAEARRVRERRAGEQ